VLIAFLFLIFKNLAMNYLKIITIDFGFCNRTAILGLKYRLPSVPLGTP